MEQKHWFMQWHENNPKTPRNKRIEEACLYFKEKYGILPKFCFVGKNDYTQDEEIKFDFGNIEVRFNKQVLPDIYWIGQEEKLI